MWKRIIIPIILLAALVLGVQRFLSWRAGVQAVERRVQERNLEHGGPMDKVVAAEYFIESDPRNEELRFVRAANLIHLSRHREARLELRGLIENRTDQLERAVTMMIDSFFEEAESIIRRADPSGFSGAQQEVIVLMDGVRATSQLYPKTSSQLRLAIVEGRRLDALIRVHSVGLADRRVELAKAQISGLAETIEKVGIEVRDLEREVSALGKQLVESCKKAQSIDPSEPRAIELLFHLHLREGRFDQARDAARKLAALEVLPIEIAGSVADALLDLEATYGQVVTTMDVDLATSLLEHPKLEGEHTVALAVAQTALALQRGNAELAEQLALPYLKRDPLYSRLRVLWAIARIRQGDIATALKHLAQYSERQRDARTLYALGLAYLARGQSYNTTLGHESLRQCLETEPNFLPARLALIESRISSGFTYEAANDILIADRINPKHPRVKAAKAMLAVHTRDYGSLATLLDMQVKDESSVNSDMVVIAAAMVLDDVPRVRAQTKALGETFPDHALTLVAQAWCDQDGLQRAKVASAVLRNLIRAVEANPMQRVRPFGVPQVDSMQLGLRNVQSDPAEVVHIMRSTLFQSRPFQDALRLVDSSLDHWPQDEDLIRTAAELHLWLENPARARASLARLRPGTDSHKTRLNRAVEAWANEDWAAATAILTEERSDDLQGSPTLRRLELALAIHRQDPKAITDSLTRLLTAHPWAEEALLSAVAHALLNNQPDRAYALLGVAEVANKKVAHLSRGRMNLGLNRASEALQSAELIVSDEDLDSEVRRWASEIRARAHIVLEQDAMAAGMFDQLGNSAKAHGLELKMRAADVYLRLGKVYAASELLSELLATPQLSPWLRDQLLARAMLVMRPQRVRASVEAVLSLEANDPLLLVYQAVTAAQEDAFVAETMLDSVLVRVPGSPRVLFVQAGVVRRFQPDQSRRLYQKLSEYPGSVGQAARDALKEMEQPTTPVSPEPGPVKEEGSTP